jgi:hypothetical protein
MRVVMRLAAVLVVRVARVGRLWKFCVLTLSMLGRHTLALGILAAGLGMMEGKEALAALKAPAFTLKYQVEDGKKLLVTAVSPAEHHFNTGAPMGLKLEGEKKPLAPPKARGPRGDPLFASFVRGAGFLGDLVPLRQ